MEFFEKPITSKHGLWAKPLLLNNKTLLRNILKDLNKCNNFTSSWIGKLKKKVKILVFPKFLYRFNAIAIKIPTSSLVEIDHLIG